MSCVVEHHFRFKHFKRLWEKNESSQLPFRHAFDALCFFCFLRFLISKAVHFFECRNVAKTVTTSVASRSHFRTDAGTLHVVGPWPSFQGRRGTKKIGRDGGPGQSAEFLSWILKILLVRHTTIDKLSLIALYNLGISWHVL